jgi:uncharacterized protein (UPF0147 family)
MPPWDWPIDAGGVLQAAMLDDRTTNSDRLLAVSMAGSLIVMNDGLAESLLEIIPDSTAPEALRATAATSLGSVLEHFDLEGFDGPEPASLSEPIIRAVRASLRRVFEDAQIPKEVRRRALEASVRAREDWHAESVRAAYLDGDTEWRLTAVFCMRFIDGFDAEIIDVLESDDPDLRHEAVIAAGTFEVDGAWPYIRALLQSEETAKTLLLVAIDATATIRPELAREVLAPLIELDDDDIAAAIDEALDMARMLGSEDADPDFDLGLDEPSIDPFRKGSGGAPTFH